MDEYLYYLYAEDRPLYGQEFDNGIDDVELGILKSIKSSIPKRPSVNILSKSELAAKKAARTEIIKEKAKLTNASPTARKKSTGIPHNVERQATRLASEYIVNDVIHQLKPKLQKILKLLKHSELQTDATNEHNIITKNIYFRKKVLEELRKISSALPKSHPVRQSICKAYLRGY